MNKSLYFSVIAILILSTFATAQFKIKIPKIGKEKPQVPNVTESGNASGSSGGKNRQMVIDDGFTFFEATPVKERSEKYKGDISKGWTLTANLRVFGTFPNNSGFKIIVIQNGKALATYSCTGKTHRKSESPVREVKNSPDDDFMSTETGGSCGRKENIFVEKPGKYDVQIFAVNGDTDAASLLRTYKIDVHEAKKIRPGNLPGASDFYIQRYAETPVAVLYLRPGLESGRVKPDYHEKGMGTSLKGNVDIYFNMAATENSDSLSFDGVPYARCFVNGQRVNFENEGQVKIQSVRGDSAKMERDGKPTEYIGFYNFWLNLPIVWKGNGQSGNPNMEKQTGEWKCDLRNGSETIRTFKWNVGDDGFPIEHFEQKSGNVNLHWGAYLIDVDIPAGGSSLDGRLMPTPNAGLFYGIPWKTERNATVPAKGKPFLTP
ncbi:MAG: hypothetical protein KDB79_03710 [Acidobacteria bacterium]|nr:hypothetical protein [Acidobacteriota bacterium]